MEDKTTQKMEGLSEEMLTDFFSRGGTFRELKNLSEETMEAVYSVAYNLYQGGKYDEAVKVFQFLCFYDHYSAKYYLGLGACRMMQKEYEQAINCFSFAATVDMTDPRAVLYIGDCNLAMNNEESARISYELAFEWAGSQKEYAKEKQRAQNMLLCLQDSKHIANDGE